MSGSHMPRPWKWDNRWVSCWEAGEGEEPHGLLVGSDGEVVLEAFSEDGRYGAAISCTASNARLIESAPLLLEALEQLAFVMERSTGPLGYTFDDKPGEESLSWDDMGIPEVVRTALAAARGEGEANADSTG